MIYLNNYLTEHAFARIVKLYRSHRMEWPLMTVNQWPLNDVCELYFRVSLDDELGADDELCDAIEKAITDYLEDEYA